MDQLVHHNLFGAGLFPVETPEMVRRYNECLAELGLEPTTRESFRIDGLGWSPEVANERGDMHYLSAGMANGLGIILTPNQRQKPIYFSYNSFDRDLIDGYFSRYKSEIADITTSRGVALDIDQGLTTYESLNDLRLVSYVIVHSMTGTLAHAAAEQRTMSDRVLAEGDAWQDRSLRDAITASARQYGDLRYRKTAIEDFRYDNLHTFYTRAFGGVFVLGRPSDGSKLLVFSDQAIAGQSAVRQGTYSLRDPEILSMLAREGFLELNLNWYRSYPAVLVYIREMLMADIVCSNEPELHYAELNGIQRKRKLLSLGDRVPSVFHELERLMKQLQTTSPTTDAQVSKELRKFLLRPVRSLPLETQLVIRLLLHRVCPLDVTQLFADDKNEFYEQYRSWPESKREWAVQKICQDYLIEPPGEEK